ncbi:MAG TPA: protein kinase [Vicinamibacterales bacterium]|nr:protein kinase [Vicinamibacterales bacterium]
MAAQPGSRVGAYEILGLLGAGGMGEVYRARDTRLQREVAIKIIPDALANDAVARGRFETEARAVASLSHPNIIAIHDFGQEGTVHYAVMELLDGRTLREMLADGPLPPRKAIDYGAQIAAGLAAAHARGVVHRDLKPENVFITRDGRAKILDFGLAKPVAPIAAAGTIAATYTPTSPGTVLGTVGYMSPEQVRGESVDHRSDIFSLGAMLYEVFSGTRAFTGPSAVETMNAILKEEPPELSVAHHALPPAIDRIVRRALEKNPVERFQSARDLGFSLEALSGSSGSMLATVDAAPRKRRGTWPLTAALVLTAGAAGFFGARAASSTAPTEPVTFTPRTFDPQIIWTARFVGDDGTIVYSSSPRGLRPDLFVARTGASAAQQIGPPGTHLLSVSSRGELAVLTDASFINQRLFRGTLARMTLDGSPRPWLENVREAEWSPDGMTLATIRVANSGDLLEYPIGTVLHRAPGYLSDLRVSPDGNHVAFFEHPVRYDDRGFVKIWDRGGSVRVLAGEYWGMEGLAWRPDGQAVLFSAAAGTNGLYQVHEVATPPGSIPRAVMPSPVNMLMLDVRRDGRWLVLSTDNRFSIRVRRPGAVREIDLPWMDSEWVPRLNADGSLVMFTDGNQSAGGNYAVALRKTDGSPPLRLGEGNGIDLSPDGKYALAYLFSPTPRIVVYPTGAGEPRTVDTAPIENVQPIKWFPDSRRIVICGNEKSKPARCFAKDVAGGPATPLTPEGFTQPGPFSPDGSVMVVQSSDGTGHLLSLKEGTVRRFEGLTGNDAVFAWTPDGRGLLVGAAVEMRVDRLDLTTGQRTPALQFELAGQPGIKGGGGVGGISITPDGRGYAYYYISMPSRLFEINGAATITQ